MLYRLWFLRQLRYIQTRYQLFSLSQSMFSPSKLHNHFQHLLNKSSWKDEQPGQSKNRRRHRPRRTVVPVMQVVVWWTQPSATDAGKVPTGLKLTESPNIHCFYQTAYRPLYNTLPGFGYSDEQIHHELLLLSYLSILSWSLIHVHFCALPVNHNWIQTWGILHDIFWLAFRCFHIALTCKEWCLYLLTSKIML